MSGFTKDELAAWADGEVTGERGQEIAAAVEADAGLQAEIAAHRALKDRLFAHYDPIAQEAVPSRLSDMLRSADERSEDEAEIVSFTAARDRIEQKSASRRWSWIAGPALAASLVLAVFLPRGGEAPGADYAGTQLAAALDTQLVAEQDANADTRILLSFANASDEYCRAYTTAQSGGIACRDTNGWRIEALGDGVTPGGTEFRQAGAAEILAMAQDMAAGDALNAEQEAAAREAGWQD